MTAAPDPAEVRAQLLSDMIEQEFGVAVSASWADALVERLALASATEAPPVAGMGAGKRRLLNGDVAHGCEACDGEDECTCRTKPTPPASVSGEVVVVQRSVLQRAERLLDGVGQRGKLLDDIRQLLAAVPEAACDACPWPVAAHNQGVCPPGSPAPEAATDKAPSAVGGVDRMREARIRRVYEQVEGELADISDRLEDEGDRVYLGSTNDAEALRELAHKATRLLQDMDYEDSPA